MILDLDLMRKKEIKINGEVHSAQPFTVKNCKELIEQNFNTDTVEGIEEELKFLSGIIFPNLNLNDVDYKFLKDYRFLLLECAFGIKKDDKVGQEEEKKEAGK